MFCRQRLGLLSRMRMLGAGIDFQFLQDPSPDPVVREHSLYRALDHSFRILLHEIFETLKHRSSRVTRVMEILLHLCPLAGHLHLVGIDDDDKIPCVGIWSEYWFMLAAQHPRNTAGDSPQCLALCIHEIPFLLDLVLFEKMCAFISE